jgi:hypothetical protein
MRKLVIVLVVCLSVNFLHAQKSINESVFLRSKLMCELDQDGNTLNINLEFVDTIWKCEVIHNTLGFDTSVVEFIKITQYKDTLNLYAYYIAYIKGYNMYFKLQGFHENDFRRFLWFMNLISDTINRKFRSSKKFSKNYKVEGIDFYKLFREYKKIKKSKFYYNSSNVEKRWINPDIY